MFDPVGIRCPTPFISLPKFFEVIFVQVSRSFLMRCRNASILPESE